MSRFDNIDCMIGMAEYEDNNFDLCICDPPYGIGDFSQSDAVDFKNVKWNEKIPDEDYFNELRRVSKKRVVWGANYYNCFEEGNGAVIWYKNIGHPSMSHCEIASVSGQKKVDYIHINWSGGIRSMQNDYCHPCQKPTKLYKWLLTKYAKEGDLILDTHVGSASSLIACEDMGFEYVGFEIDKDYYDSAQKRLTQFRSQLKLAI